MNAHGHMANKAGPIWPESSSFFLLTSPDHNSNIYHSSINNISSTSYLETIEFCQWVGIKNRQQQQKHSYFSMSWQSFQQNGKFKRQELPQDFERDKPILLPNRQPGVHAASKKPVRSIKCLWNLNLHCFSPTKIGVFLEPKILE